MTKLPNLICPGAQKAGTSTLYMILRQHPEISRGTTKEVQFFDKKYNKGLDWYRQQFEGASGRYVIDFTPGYMHKEIYVKRMHDVLGSDTKFIFMLRNPVDRMYSAYKMFLKLGLESREDAGEAFKKDYERFLLGKEDRYFSMSLYGRQMVPFMELFKKENMKFVLFEEFMKDLEKGTEDILDFLGLEMPGNIDLNVWINKSHGLKNDGVSKFVRRTVGMAPNSIKKIMPRKAKEFFTRNVMKRTWDSAGSKAEKLDPSVGREFTGIFMEDIEKMERLTGIDVRVWKEKYK